MAKFMSEGIKLERTKESLGSKWLTREVVQQCCLEGFCTEREAFQKFFSELEKPLV